MNFNKSLYFVKFYFVIFYVFSLNFERCFLPYLLFFLNKNLHTQFCKDLFSKMTLYLNNNNVLFILTELNIHFMLYSLFSIPNILYYTSITYAILFVIQVYLQELEYGQTARETDIPNS